MDEKTLRQNLLELLDGGNAYAPLQTALARLKPENRFRRPAAAVHSIWEELEHMRIAQEDILRYTLDPMWKSPAWPAGYWPAANSKRTARMWSATMKLFFADLDELKALVRRPRFDLTSKILHGEGRTYLRQVLLTADHNAYHLGQIVMLRKLLGDWPD
jgi:uncharacterized damage-inducible protein DinB